MSCDPHIPSYRLAGVRKLCLGFLFAILMLSLNSCSEKAMIRELPPLPTSREIPVNDPDPHQKALKQKFEVHLQNRWHIVESRYFLVPTQPPWDAVRKFVGGQLEDRGHTKKIEDQWGQSDKTSWIIFSRGLIRREFIAVAMDDEPVNGQWLLGYFSLEK